MKVSLHTVQQYLDFEVSSLEDLVDRIGSQLGAVEEVEKLTEKYRGVLVVRILACVEHPNSDHMHICTIDDGGKVQGVERDESGYVQVVCGAPNVREGLMVAWLPPGSIVPDSVGREPFVLGTRELRGVKSNGMLASQRELALGDSHDGILELTMDAQPGDDFAKAYGLDDTIIDIENKMFTHRPDCFGQLGVAREIAGIFGNKFTSPEWYAQTQTKQFEQEADTLSLKVRNEVPNLVPRFMVVPLSGIKVEPSPLWLQSFLQRLGVRPISNVVDVTNYLMLLTGQPMHAYDYDKLKGNASSVTLEVRNPKPNESLNLLNGKSLRPRDEAIVIATETELVGLGGVMGGATSEVDHETSRIVLESATFDMYSVRRTSMAHGLFTDAVTRFNKGQSPLQNDEIMAEAVHLLREIAGAKVSGPVIDDNHFDLERRWVHLPVPVTTEFINSRLGIDLSATDMQLLLQNVECVVDIESDNLTVTAPFWRTDIETREDVVEEVGRLYGFDKLPLMLPRRSIVPAQNDPLLQLKSLIRTVLAKAGANETLTYSFVHGDLLDRVDQNKEDAFQVGNALSPDLQYYRLSLTPSLLDKVHANIKSGYDQFALFEMGKGHDVRHMDDAGLPKEFELLELVYVANNKIAKRGAAFYEARAFLTDLASEFEVKLEFRPFETDPTNPATLPYDRNRSAEVWVSGTDKILGIVGEFKPIVRHSLKLPDATAGFAIDLEALLNVKGEQYASAYVPLPRFPKVTQDITLKIPLSVSYLQLYTTASEALAVAQPEQTHASFEPIDIYQAADSEYRHVTFRLQIASYDKTMTDAEVTKLLDALAATSQTSCGAERV